MAQRALSDPFFDPHREHDHQLRRAARIATGELTFDVATELSAYFVLNCAKCCEDLTRYIEDKGYELQGLQTGVCLLVDTILTQVSAGKTLAPMTRNAITLHVMSCGRCIAKHHD